MINVEKNEKKLSLKRAKETISDPLINFKTRIDFNGQPEKIEIINRTNYKFEMEVQNYLNTFLWKNNHLKLISTGGKNIVLFEKSLENCEISILGMKIIKKKPNSGRPKIQFGIKGLHESENPFEISKSEKYNFCVNTIIVKL